MSKINGIPNKTLSFVAAFKLSIELGSSSFVIVVMRMMSILLFYVQLMYTHSVDEFDLSIAVSTFVDNKPQIFG